MKQPQILFYSGDDTKIINNKTNSAQDNSQRSTSYDNWC